MTEESVKVAVRVRPFNQREKDRKAVSIIQMQNNMTIITDPKNKNQQKKFTFDFSYWSHDGFKEDKLGVLEKSGDNSRYASQRRVYDDLGVGVLENAFNGYNCSLFAYGQTGSGKSYSMVGVGANKGIVPTTCDELFKAIEANTDKKKRYEVTYSMLEIYNECVRDLLNAQTQKGGLAVRQASNQGFYVQGLKKIPVGSYREIEQWMIKGTSSRTVASTNMNATSSRAHTVVTISFNQILESPTGETMKTSVMNLVDLAGSERAESTGATGDRLKEGANINKSLSALGNVISALAEMSTSSKKVFVPYRDSVLTKLLENALGGNSKTIMIAALSPADINFDETLSTLRYADRAKQIKNKAVVNESETDKLIRQLMEENEKLKKSLQNGAALPTTMNTKGMTEKEIAKMRQNIEEELRSQLLSNQETMEASNKSAWEKKLKEARAEAEATRKEDKSVKSSKIPHLVNLNEDPQLSGIIFHLLEANKISIGRPDSSKNPDIALNGLSISPSHAVIEKKKNAFFLSPGTAGAKTKINGLPVTDKKELHHKDRILFGSNHMYLFLNPLDTKCDQTLPKDIDWDFSQREIAQAKGYDTGSGLNKEQQIVQDQILDILPLVSEVNAISEELNKHRSFDVVLLSPAAQEGIYGVPKSTKVMVKMRNLHNDNTWLWERGKFISRRYAIQELYQNFLDGEDMDKITNETDPFWEPPENVLIGTANVFLQALGYLLDFDDKLVITDYKGLEEGFIYVNVSPCNAQGLPTADDDFTEDPATLVGKPYHMKVTIRRVEVFKSRFSRGVHVAFRVFKDTGFVTTPTIKDTLEPEFNFTKVFSFPKITREHLEFFASGFLTLMVYGVQEDALPTAKYASLSTKELRQLDNMVPTDRRDTMSSVHHGPSDSSELNRVKSELIMMHKKNQRLSNKELRLQQLCTEWSHKTPEEQNFESFFRAVSALAHSTGSKFKTNAEVITKTIRAMHLFSGRSVSQDGHPNFPGPAKTHERPHSASSMPSRDHEVTNEEDPQDLLKLKTFQGGAPRTNSAGDIESRACSLM